MHIAINFEKHHTTVLMKELMYHECKSATTTHELLRILLVYRIRLCNIFKVQDFRIEAHSFACLESVEKIDTTLMSVR